MKKLIVIIFCMTLLIQVFASPNKEKKHKIKSTTTMMTVFENGKPSTYKESYEEFDKNGNTTLYTGYSKEGTILIKQTMVYDNLQNITEETLFDANANKNIRKTYKYTVFKDKSPLGEEAEFTATGTLVKKTVYTYNASGKKATETVSDGSGNVIKKVLYNYNAKNLKTHKQTLNAASIQESVKEWQYEYY